MAGSPDVTDRSTGTRPVWVWALVTWLVIVAVSAFVVLDFRGPTPLGRNAPLNEFSEARARVHLEKIARATHPPGSFEYADVREYLVDTLTDLGFEVQLQVTTMDDVATLSNVLGRIEGSCDTDDAVLLNTHYDSVPTGPGAGDAGIATAALLETARALTESKQLCNDVIVLLNGAEESGLTGAEAFAARHKWVDDVISVVNLDARGETGPLILGEWGEVSPELLRRVADVVPRFFTNSLINEAQGQVHTHSTDMRVWLTLGIPGANGVHIGDSIYYHAPGDTPAAVSGATLQHNGDAALALARLFGNTRADEFPAPADGVWVSLTSNLLLVYPSWFAWLLGGAVLALLIAVVQVARRRGARWSALGYGVLTVVGAAVAGAVLVTVLLNLVRLLHPGAGEYFQSVGPQYEDLPDATAYWWAFAAAAGAVSVVVFGFARRWLTTVELAVSGVGMIAVLALVTTAFAQPISYLLVVPAFGSLVGMLIWLLVARGSLDRLGSTVLVALCAVPALLVYMGMLRFSAAARLGISAYFMPLVAILLALLIPHLEALRRVDRRIAPGALALLSVVLLGFGAVNVDIDPSTTRSRHVDQLEPIASFAPVVFDREGDSPWTVGAVESNTGRTCLEASVQGDKETSDIGWCPVLGELAPTLDYQWGRTATGRWTQAPGARESDLYPYRSDATSAPILFGTVKGDPAIVRVVADGVSYDTQPTVEPGFDGSVWVVALPAGTSAVDEIVTIDAAGRETRVAPGFQILYD
ncbi:MAG: M28 family peptidase [Acidimicrobiia bacterium]|nr:M28 family peptidase [Acidimicrobiia bacterium]